MHNKKAAYNSSFFILYIIVIAVPNSLNDFPNIPILEVHLSILLSNVLNIIL